MSPYHRVRPYPDEELGSIVTRACHQAGLRPHQFPEWYFGAPHLTHIRIYKNLLVPVAGITGLSPRELLRAHTLVPYGVAALPSESARRILAELARGGALAQSPVLGKIARHWCDACVREDLAAYGESYWHRCHLLPGVTLCHRHGTPLLRAPERPPFAPIHRVVSHWIRHELPHELDGTALWMPASTRLQLAISVWSARALRGRRALPSIDLQPEALRGVFGTVLLRHAGLSVTAPAKRSASAARIFSIVAAKALEQRSQGTQLELLF